MVPYEKLYKDAMKAATQMGGGSGSHERSPTSGMMSRKEKGDPNPKEDDLDVVEMNAFYMSMFQEMAEENIRTLKAAGEKRLGRGPDEAEVDEEED